MKIKTVPVRFKTGEADGLKEGEFLVYPSTFTREPDSYGDVVAKGAFDDAIKAWKESGDVLPGMYLHDPNQIVASATDMGEDEHGWWVKGEFDDDPAAQRIYRLVKGRRLSALSFAYDTLDEGEVALEDGRKANELRKLTPHEFSFLPKGFAANGDTSVVAVKSAVDALVEGVKSGRVLSAKNEVTLEGAVEALTAATASIKSVLSQLAAGDDPAKTGGHTDVKDEGGNVKSEGEGLNPSRLALANHYITQAL